MNYKTWSISMNMNNFSLEEKLLISENRVNGIKDKFECAKCKEIVIFMINNNIIVPNEPRLLDSCGANSSCFPLGCLPNIEIEKYIYFK